MRDFGPINREVEASAMKTLFFTDSVFEGQACRLSVVNYLALLFRARNWRFHNIACVALVCAGTSDSLLAELWSCIRIGSWTSPQLGATAAYLDPDFNSKAVALIADSGTYYKSIVSLAALLADRHVGQEELSDSGKANVAEAKQIDRDDAGAIAVAWHKKLCEAFGAT